MDLQDIFEILRKQILNGDDLRRLDDERYQARLQELEELMSTTEFNVQNRLHQNVLITVPFSFDKDDDLSLKNWKMFDWVRTTRYRRVAAGLMTKIVEETRLRADKRNIVIADYCSFILHNTQLNIIDLDMCNEHIDGYFKVLETVAQHDRQALQLGLDSYQAILIDAICGTILHGFPQKMIDCAKEIQQMVDRQLDSEAILRFKMEVDWVDSFLKMFQPVLTKYGIELRLKEHDIRFGYLIDWLDKYTTVDDEQLS